jgi:tetratricopeptide (TPR) repeat protein
MADIEKINELIGSKSFNEVKDLLEEALQETPDNVELLKLAGLTYINLEQWQKACRYFESAVKYASGDATAIFYLAKCYEHQKDYISAKNYYIKVIELRPEYEDAYKSLCITLAKLKDNADAIKYADIAIGLFPDEYIFDFIRGTVSMNLKNFLEALSFLFKARKKAPDKTEILNSIGTCYMALNDSENALANYKKVLEIDSNNAAAYYNIGSVYQIKQDHETAIEYLSKAVELDEDDERFLSSLAMSEVKIKDYDCALTHYKQLSV